MFQRAPSLPHFPIAKARRGGGSTRDPAKRKGDSVGKTGRDGRKRRQNERDKEEMKERGREGKEKERREEAGEQKGGPGLAP